MINHKLLIFPRKYQFEVHILLSGLRKFRVLVQNASMMTRKSHKHMVKKNRSLDNYLKMQSCNLDIDKKKSKFMRKNFCLIFIWATKKICLYTMHKRSFTFCSSIYRRSNFKWLSSFASQNVHFFL